MHSCIPAAGRPPAGASDAASCICIILELARTIVANPAVRLHAPVLFLMNGGEETLSQASNGFFATSRRALGGPGAGPCWAGGTEAAA